MVDAVFFEGLGITVLFLSVVCGTFFGLVYLFRFKFPFVRPYLKYEVFKRKVDPDYQKYILEKEDLSTPEMIKRVLLKVNNRRIAYDLGYIHKKWRKKLKGGNK